MKHKHAELLIAAAEDADALFSSDPHLVKYHIDAIIIWPEKNWQLVEKPVVKVEYYKESFGAYQFYSIQENDGWDMKITITDGVRKAEFK